MELLSIACPKLEKQTLLPTYQLVPLLHKDNKGMLLKIHGPSLKYFLTDFAYTEIWIKNASHLAVIEIAFDRSWKGGNIQWVKFIHGLSVLQSLKKLVLDGKFVEFVAGGNLQWKVIVGNGHLVTLYLPDVCLENVGVMSVHLTLIAMF